MDMHPAFGDNAVHPSTASHTEKQLKPVAKWLDNAIEILGLGGWRLELSKDACNEEANAEIEIHKQKKAARVSLCGNFFSLPERYQRYCLTHELLHLILRNVDQEVMVLESKLGSVVWDIWQEGFNNEMETAVDHLGFIISSYLPKLDTSK